MAEVTGDIGGTPVQLNNAATEATLKQLVSAVALLSVKLNKDAKTQDQINRQMKKFYENLDKANKQQVNLTKSQREAQDQIRDGIKLADERNRIEKRSQYIAREVTFGLFKLNQAAQSAVTGLTSIMNEMSTLGNSITGAANVFAQIPVVGTVLSRVFGAIAGAADRSYKAFQQSASVGANFSGSINEMIESASLAGLTIDQFSALVAKNGESLAMLGKGTADGARRFATLGKMMRDSGVADQLYRMGYTAQDINDGMLQFTSRLAKGGALQTMTTTQIADVTGRYLKELDAVAKLTGQSKEALQQQEQARMRDAQYLTLRNRLDAEGQKNLELLMASIPEGMRDGAKEVLATGTATTEAGAQFLAFMQQSGRDLASLGINARRTGTITLGQVTGIGKTMKREATDFANSGVGETAGLFINEMNGIVVAANQYKAQQQDLEQAIADQTKAERERKAQEERLKKEGLDPASLQRFQQQIAELSNRFTKLLGENIPTLMGSFNTLANFITNYLIPAFKFVIDNLKELVVGFLAFKAAMIAYQLKVKFQESKAHLWGKTPADARFVRPLGAMGPGGPVDVDGDEKGKGKGKGKKPSRVGGFLKGGGLAIAGMGASYASGALEEAGHEKSAAATDIAGTAATYAGTGMMIGSVIPGLGTAVGGIIGGLAGSALGLWDNWNRLFGKSLDDIREEAAKKIQESGGLTVNEKLFAEKDKQSYESYIKDRDALLKEKIQALGKDASEAQKIDAAKQALIEVNKKYANKIKSLSVEVPADKKTTTATPVQAEKPEDKKTTTATPVQAEKPEDKKTSVVDFDPSKVAKNYNDPMMLLKQELSQQKGKEIQDKLKEIEKLKEDEKAKAVASMPNESSAETARLERQEILAKKMDDVNTSLQQLIALEKRYLTIGEQHLDVTRSMTGDLFLAA
jgi:hypothetical protein